jgi:hypothetical protein
MAGPPSYCPLSWPYSQGQQIAGIDDFAVLYRLSFLAYGDSSTGVLEAARSKKIAI